MKLKEAFENVKVTRKMNSTLGLRVLAALERDMVKSRNPVVRALVGKPNRAAGPHKDKRRQVKHKGKAHE